MTSILVVDDSVLMRRMVAETLRFAGYDAIEAQDGEEALKMAETLPVNLVVTDINMPNMDGIALVRALRARPQYRFTPILMLTTEPEEKKRQCKAAGATGWISKPFDPDRLLAAIGKLIG